MSYDLFLSGLPKADELLEWLGERDHYQVSETQAAYENENTGVYFTFDVEDGKAAFNLNYFRPSFFGLEAEIEVSAVVKEFSAKIDDPQSEGMADGPYSAEGFLRGWNAGNRFAHQAIGSRDSTPRLSLPAKVLEDVWRWNYAKERYQEFLGEVEMVTSFVPSIWFLTRPSEPERVLTASVWGEAMPIALPEIDLLLIIGEPLKLLWKKDLDLTGFPKGNSQFALDDSSFRLPPHSLLDYQEPPGKLLANISARAVADDKPTRLSADSILDRELSA